MFTLLEKIKRSLISFFLICKKIDNIYSLIVHGSNPILATNSVTYKIPKYSTIKKLNMVSCPYYIVTLNDITTSKHKCTGVYVPGPLQILS